MNTNYPKSMVVLAYVLLLMTTILYFAEMLHFVYAPGLCVLLMVAVLEFCLVAERKKELARRASIWAIPHDAPIARLARRLSGNG